MFHTEYTTQVSAPMEASSQAVDTMIHYLQTNPEKLGDLYFAGLGMQQEKKKNAFYLIWKESTYDPDRQYSRLVLDVLVDEKPFLKDVVIEATVTDSLSGNQRDIRVDIHYAGSLIKEAYGTFHVKPVDEQNSQLGIDVHVKFGWFFRIFISRKVYSDTIDWRLARFVENISLVAQGIIPTDAYWAEVKTENWKRKGENSLLLLNPTQSYSTYELWTY